MGDKDYSPYVMVYGFVMAAVTIWAVLSLSHRDRDPAYVCDDVHHTVNFIQNHHVTDTIYPRDYDAVCPPP